MAKIAGLNLAIKKSTVDPTNLLDAAQGCARRGNTGKSVTKTSQSVSSGGQASEIRSKEKLREIDKMFSDKGFQPLGGVVNVLVTLHQLRLQ
jgi:hypothetical protein